MFAQHRAFAPAGAISSYRVYDSVTFRFNNVFDDTVTL